MKYRIYIPSQDYTCEVEADMCDETNNGFRLYRRESTDQRYELVAKVPVEGLVYEIQEKK